MTTTTTTRTAARPRMTDEPGVRFGIANGLLVATFVVAGAVRLDTTATAWVAAVAACLLGVGLSLSVSLTASLGAISWAWFTGFVENGYGQLTFTGDDVLRLATFVLAAIVLVAITRRGRRLVRGRSHG